MGISALVASAATAVGASAATAAVVGSVVSGAVIGAGVSGAIAAVTGGDVGDAMLTGALTGGLAGPVSGAIASVAPSAAAAGSMANAVATGAVLGGGTALAQGGDVLTGALLGGAGAGVGKYVGDTLGLTTTPSGGGVSPVSPDDIAINTTSDFTNATNQNILNSPIMQGGTGATSVGTGVTAQPIIPTTYVPRIDPAGIAYDVFNNPMGFMDDAGVMHDLSGKVVSTPTKVDLIATPTTTTTNAVAPTTTPATTPSGATGQEFVDLTNENILNSPLMQGGTGATSPGTGILKPFVNAAGDLIDTAGNTVRNLAGNFVDRSGMVYDEMGNPVARLQGTHPSVDYTGILNPGSTITRLDGSNVIDLLGQPVAVPTTTPATGSSLPATGQEYMNQTNTDILNSPMMQNGTGATSPGIGQPVTSVPVGPTGVVPTTQTFGGGSTGGGNFGLPSSVTSGVIGGTAGSAAGLAKPLTQPGANNAGAESQWSWGQVPTIVEPGLNPGLYARAVAPYYENAAPNQSQYYWGAHPYAHTIEDLANYNQIPNAPAQPYGPARSAVGGTDALDINQYISQYFNPVRQAAAVGSQPQYAGAGGTLMPVVPV